jgi:hypothetical protein
MGKGIDVSETNDPGRSSLSLFLGGIWLTGTAKLDQPETPPRMHASGLWCESLPNSLLEGLIYKAVAQDIVKAIVMHLKGIPDWNAIRTTIRKWF